MRQLTLVILGFLTSVNLLAQDTVALSSGGKLTVFRPQKESSKGTAIIICPGGAYAFRSDNGEGVQPAKLLNEAGITAFLLDYSLPYGNDTLPLTDARLALRYVREHSKTYGIDAHKVGMLGFSAGGHLVATTGTHFRNAMERPDFMVLAYPVISMVDSLTHAWSKDNLLGKSPSAEKVKLYSNELQVTDDTPGTFITHAMDDHGVKVANSLYFLAALQQHHVSAELFLYAGGGHAFDIHNKTASVQWTKSCISWIKQIKWRRTTGD